MGDYTEQAVKNAGIVQAIPPAIHSWLGPAGNGVPICLKGWDHCTVIIDTGTWAGGHCAVTIAQDVSVTPTSAKPLLFTRYFTNAAATGSNTLLELPCAGTFDLDTSNAVYAVEIDGDELDTLNCFDCLTLTVTDDVKVDNPYSAMYVLSKSRFSGASATMLDATID